MTLPGQSFYELARPLGAIIAPFRCKMTSVEVYRRIWTRLRLGSDAMGTPVRISDSVPERLVTVDDAAAYAGRTPRTIRRWIAEGSLTPHKADLGDTQIHVDLDEIDRKRVIRPLGSA